MVKYFQDIRNNDNIIMFKLTEIWRAFWFAGIPKAVSSLESVTDWKDNAPLFENGATDDPSSDSESIKESILACIWSTSFPISQEAGVREGRATMDCWYLTMSECKIRALAK